MRWAGHVARMGEERRVIGSWWGNRKERDHWGDLGVNWCIILGWIFGDRAVYSFLVGKLGGKRPLGRTRRRCVDNIRMDLWGEVVYRLLLGKPEGMRPLGRSCRRWVDNISMGLLLEGSV